MQTLNLIITLAAITCGGAFTTGCGRTETRDVPTQTRDTQRDQAHDHDHDEHPLGTVTILGMEIEGAQSHGAVEPGKLCHLVVKLPYNDSGQTIVRAWIGTEDRDLYYVGRGEYAAAHDDYDIHVEAPDPLPPPELARWWIEIERPDGTRGVGSLPILTEVP